MSQAIEICDLHGMERGLVITYMEAYSNEGIAHCIAWFTRDPTFSQLSLTFLPGMIYVTPEVNYTGPGRPAVFRKQEIMCCASIACLMSAVMQTLARATPLLHCVTGVRILAGTAFEVVGMQSSARCNTGIVC